MSFCDKESPNDLHYCRLNTIEALYITIEALSITIEVLYITIEALYITIKALYITIEALLIWLKLVKVLRMVVSTYQAASGAGAAAMKELELQTREVLEGKRPTCNIFKQQYAFNLFSHNAPVLPNGYNEEEMKLVKETRKIWVLWNTLAIEALKEASDPSASADLAVVLMQEGLAHILLVGKSYPKGLLVAFKLKSTSSEDDSAKPESVAEESVDLKSSSENDEKNAEAKKVLSSENEEETEEDNKNEKKTEPKKMSADMYKDDKDVVLREDLKYVFQKFGNVKYIDFKMGEESGYIRFEEAQGAQKARAAAVLTEEGGLIVKNFVAVLDPVTD